MNKITMEQGIEAIMAIIDGEGNGKKIGGAVAGGAHTQSSKQPKQPKQPNLTTPTVAVKADEIVYDGYGHVLSVNSVSTHIGSKKKRKSHRPSDLLRDDLVLATQVLLSRTKAFEGKIGYNKTEGIIIRLADADYTVKIGGHSKREFENREQNFIPTKSFITRGKAENHSPAIAKIIVAEFENQFPCASFGGFTNGKPFTLLEAKASSIRFENGNSEFSFKITKKRARVVMEG